MAARVEVVHGPDAGWRYTVLVGEVRIGRGAGHQIKMTDPAWGEGHLRVQFRGGGYLVTNHMPYPVFLDGQLLSPGEQRTWYAGSGLQPTGETLLRLEAVEAPVGALPEGAEGGVIAEPPGRRTAGKSKSLEYVALAAIAVAMAFIGYKHFTKPKPPTPAAQFTADVAPALADAGTRSGPAGRQAEAIRHAVQVAVFRQSEGNLAEARERYLDARDLIVAARQTPDFRPDPVAAAAVEKAHAFVTAQLQGL